MFGVTAALSRSVETVGMTDTITLTGLVATVPRHLTTGEGLHITSFRLASSQRRYDRGTNSWVDGDTNWYTISTFRRLATGAAASVSKGDRIIVTGRLRMRDWKSTDRAGTTVEVDADALGHDLNWGTATFTRSMSAASTATADAVDEEAGDPSASESATTSDSSAEEDAMVVPTDWAEAAEAEAPF